MKRLLALFLSVLIVFSISIPVFAATETEEQLVQEEATVSETFIDPVLVGTTLNSGIATCDYYNEIPVVSKTIKTYKTVYVTPTGQPSLGYEGGTGAFVFFFSSGGNSVKFKVTIDTENVTFTAETGSFSSSGQGYGDNVPSTEGRYRFEFKKYYVITTKKVDVYQYNSYKYSYYIHTPEYSLGHRWVKL